MQGAHRANPQHQKLYQQIKFLQTENQRLKDELSDARDLIQMNKIEIDVLSKQKSHDKELIDVIHNYRQQIQNLQSKRATLYENFKKISSQVLFFQCQKLVIEQLNQQLQSEQKSIEQLHKHRVQQLTELINGLQEKTNNCERNHQNYDCITGFVQKNRDLFNPLDQALQFKRKEDCWNEEITYIKEQLSEHKKNEQNLLLANGVLRNKVVSLQAKLAMPNKNLGEILDKSLKRLMLYFIETQKKMLTGDDSDSEEQDLELIAPQLIELFPHKELNSASDIKVPSLNILKVRNQQMKGTEKIKQELIRRNQMTKDQKIEKLQVQLEFTRRNLTKNMIEFKSENERRKLLERICEELEERNEILIKSNENLKSKMEKIKKDFMANKDQQHMVKDLEYQEQQNDMNALIKDGEKKKKMDMIKTRQEEVNKYLENVETPFEYKLHLQLLAKDLNKNPKLKNLQNKVMKKTNQNDSFVPKMKKSTSNPFLYFNERRGQIMQVQPQKQNKQQPNEPHQRMQQTQFLFMGQNKKLRFEQDLDDVDDY